MHTLHPTLQRLSRRFTWPAVLFNLAITALVAYLFADQDSLVLISGNTLLTSDIITREAFRVLRNNCVFIRSINRTYDSKFANSGVKTGKNGDTIRVRKPPRYIGRTGAAMEIEDITETYMNVTVDTQFGVDLDVGSWDLTLSIENFSERILQPACARIATKMDTDLMAKIIDLADCVGTPGTTPNALITFGQAGAKLDDNSAPQDDKRYMTITPTMQYTIVDAAKSLFQASAEIAAQYRKGKMGTFGGFEWQMSQNCPTHTVGALGGTPLVNAVGSIGTSLVTDGWTAAVADRVNRGDIFTLTGVNKANPQNYNDVGSLQQFVARALGASDVNGNMTLSIFPAITPSGQMKTVTASPANNAALTFLGAANTTSPQGVGHHRDAFYFVTADLEVPKGCDMAGRMSDEDTGLAIRFIRQFEARSDKWLTRLDVAYGCGVLREELGCRVAG